MAPETGKVRMKRLAGIALFSLGYFVRACEGDCMACHPALEKMKGAAAADHAVLGQCRTCHAKPMRESNTSAAGCGQDCWQCHDIRQVRFIDVPAHRDLERCIECHVSLDRNLFGGGSMWRKIRENTENKNGKR